MKTNINRKLMLLSKYTIFLAITLFSVILISSWNIEAASFRYSDFDWDKISDPEESKALNQFKAKLSKYKMEK